MGCVGNLSTLTAESPRNRLVALRVGTLNGQAPVFANQLCTFGPGGTHQTCWAAPVHTSSVDAAAE